jgi:hypothetical protein
LDTSRDSPKNLLVIYSKSNIAVPPTGLFTLDPYLLDAGVEAYKLTIQVLSVNAKEEEAYGPVILQVTESQSHVFDDDLNTGQWLEVGFNSRGFATPITGMRLRTPTLQELIESKRKQPVLPGLIHFTFYG